MYVTCKILYAFQGNFIRFFYNSETKRKKFQKTYFLNMELHYIYIHYGVQKSQISILKQKESNFLHRCPLSPKFQLYFKKGSSKNFLWASRLWVGRRGEPILDYVPNDEKKNLVQKRLNDYLFLTSYIYSGFAKIGFTNEINVIMF